MVGSSSLQLADLSENQALVADNLRAILNSEAYRRAHEDASLLQSDEMRGVRMLLEITKPEAILNELNIQSTVIVFGGVNVVSCDCLLYTSPSPRDVEESRMPSSA